MQSYKTHKQRRNQRFQVLNDKKNVPIARGVLAMPEAYQTMNDLYTARVHLTPLEGCGSVKGLTAHVTIDIRQLHDAKGVAADHLQ
jgi:hypothetical protein